MNHKHLFSLLFVFLVLPGCDEAEPEGETSALETTGADTDGNASAGTTGQAAMVDPDAIAEQAIDFASLQLMNEAPFASQHGLADTVNIWVPAAAADAYLGLSESTVFEPGTILVKEQLDAEGELDSMTVMFKGPDGYAPEAGDWWYGLISPEGDIMVGGQPGACVSCHTQAQDTGFVYGLP